MKAVILSLLAGITPPLQAQDDVHTFVRAWTKAAVESAISAPATDSTLRTLLELEAPWRDVIVSELESSSALARLREAGSGLPRPSAARYRVLLDTLAERQGASSLAQMRNELPVGELAVDFGVEETHWFTFSAEGASGELRIHGGDCTPNVTVFDGASSLPAEPLARPLRFAADLAQVSVVAGQRVRIRPGNCKRERVSLTTEWIAKPNIAEASRKGALAVRYDETVILPIGVFPTRKFTVKTEPDTLYEIFAAQVDIDDDPALMKSNRKDPVKLAEADDDGGWGLGARLGPYVGTGEQVSFLARRMSPTTSSVAVYVRCVPAAEHRADSSHVFKLWDNVTEWRRLPLPKGTWTVRTRSTSKASDPYVRAYSGLDGELIEESDDISEEDLDARLTVTMEQAGTVYLKLGAASTAGSEFRLEVTRGAAQIVDLGTPFVEGG